MGKTLLTLNLAGLIAVLILLWHFWSEKRTLRAMIHHSLPPRENTFATALGLAGLIYAQVPRANDPRFIPIAALDFLGGTPVSILRRGGCCSGFARLYITGLGALGIRAAKVALYQATGKYQHALAEVFVGEEPMIVDPTYGFHYVDSDGRPIGLDELRQGLKPKYRRLPHSERRRPTSGRSAESYPANDIYNFDFSQTKTANWTKTWIRRSAYRILKALTAGRIDTLRRPLWMEWPQIVAAAGVIVGLLMFDLATLLLYGAEFSFSFQSPGLPLPERP